MTCPACDVPTPLFGGTAPIANDRLIGETGNALIPAYHMLAAAQPG